MNCHGFYEFRKEENPYWVTEKLALIRFKTRSEELRFEVRRAKELSKQTNEIHFEETVFGVNRRDHGWVFCVKRSPFTASPQAGEYTLEFALLLQTETTDFGGSQESCLTAINNP
jgi:hypothetical protein